MISVIIAAYNAESLLSTALESVLVQTVQPEEIVVVDDASTDYTVKLAQTFPRVRTISLDKNVGQAAALNVGILNTTGAVIAFLDADDVWTPNKLEVQQQALVDLDAVGCHAKQNGSIAPSRLPSAFAFKRSMLSKVGLLREDLGGQSASWVEWIGRLHKLNVKMGVVSDVLYERRLHDANYGVTHRLNQRDEYIRAIHEIHAKPNRTSR